MNHAVAAALAAALILAGSDAAAHASATAQIGDVSVSQDGSGPNFAITEWDVTLGTGEGVDVLGVDDGAGGEGMGHGRLLE